MVGILCDIEETVLLLLIVCESMFVRHNVIKNYIEEHLSQPIGLIILITFIGFFCLGT